VRFADEVSSPHVSKGASILANLLPCFRTGPNQPLEADSDYGIARGIGVSPDARFVAQLMPGLRNFGSVLISC
jgi:hypothetical protein